MGKAVITQPAELRLIGQAHQEYEQLAFLVLALRITTVGPAKADTASDIPGMSLKELFETARNDEPIVADEVAILRSGVRVSLPSLLLNCSGVRFLQDRYRLRLDKWCQTGDGGFSKIRLAYAGKPFPDRLVSALLVQNLKHLTA